MKVNQFGRSMVEMLGVLAIIGVLSVGAIAGYQKAMFKHKMNKTMDIISHAVNRLAELDTMRLDTTVEFDTSLLVKYGLMPDCDVNHVNIWGEKGGYCPLPLGEVAINFTQSENYSMTAYLDLIFLQEPFDSCAAFLSSGIYKNVPDDWWYPYCEDCDGGGFISLHTEVSNKYFYGNSEYALSQGATSNPTNQNILEACEICKNANYCNIYWVIRNDF
ncbi:MAG: hypothetical protein IJ019_03045 [Alphaproteobacteria bacterium]|nr:hypothetical protein [Alphaproteobacteria bacterium]